MSFSLGVFDVFGSALPGSAYLGLLLVLLDRLGWTRPVEVFGGSTPVAVIAFATVSYALGVITYGLARSFGRTLARRDLDPVAVERFLRRNPSATGRPFVSANKFLLLAKIELTSPESAMEISRVRATATMLGGLVIPGLLAALGSLCLMVDGEPPAPTAVAAAVFAALGALAHRRALEMAVWAHLATLEKAYWITEIDQLITAGPVAAQP